MKPIRRIVTGEDAAGRSRVLWDTAAPNVNVGTIAPSAGMTDVWVFETCPAQVRGDRDGGNLRFSFEPPDSGGHLRLVHSAGKPDQYDRSQDGCAVPLHEPRQRLNASTWDRGGQDAFSSPVHRSETIDLGVVVQGRRTLLLDDGAHPLEPGDVVVQLRNWHGWTNPDAPSIMAFVMMGARRQTDGDR